jgi:hypothetical protein
MPKLMAIAETLVLEQILARSLPVSKKSRAGLALFAFSALLLIVATGFLIAAFHSWVVAQFAPDIAALITAGVVFALAIIAALTAYGVMHQRELRMAAVKHDLKSNLQDVFAAFDDELGDKVRENPVTAVALAGLAGFILADRVL